MTNRLLILPLAIAALCGSCKKKQPTVKPPPPIKTAQAQDPAPDTTQNPAPAPAPPPDSLKGIGMETAGLVRLWVLTLKEVNTEEDATAATERLDKISGQFDYLRELAAKIPAVGEVEFKHLDDQIDQLIREAAVGLESESQRIFLLPDQIKSKVLPAHQKLTEKFRNMSRAIRDTHAKADATK